MRKLISAAEQELETALEAGGSVRFWLGLTAALPLAILFWNYPASDGLVPIPIGDGDFWSYAAYWLPLTLAPWYAAVARRINFLPLCIVAWATAGWAAGDFVGLTTARIVFYAIAQNGGHPTQKEVIFLVAVAPQIGLGIALVWNVAAYFDPQGLGNVARGIARASKVIGRATLGSLAAIVLVAVWMWLAHSEVTSSADALVQDCGSVLRADGSWGPAGDCPRSPSDTFVPATAEEIARSAQSPAKRLPGHRLHAATWPPGGMYYGPVDGAGFEPVIFAELSWASSDAREGAQQTSASRGNALPARAATPQPNEATGRD